MHEVIIGRPDTLLNLQMDPEGPVSVYDINNRVGADSYFTLLRRDCPARILTPQQAVLLFRSVGIAENDAWGMLDASVDAVIRRTGDLVKTMEKTGMFSPNFAWKFVSLPPAAVFLGAETLPDEFWHKLEEAYGGQYWVIGDPFQVLRKTAGYTHLLSGTKMLQLPKSLWPGVSHMVPKSVVTLVDDGPEVCSSTLKEFRDFLEKEQAFGAVVTFTNAEVSALPEWVAKPRFREDHTPAVLRTLVDRLFYGDNEIIRRILKVANSDASAGKLRIRSEASINLKNIDLDTPMCDLVDEPELAEVSVERYVRKPWKYRYPTGHRLRATSVFALVSASHVAFNQDGPWREEQRYKATVAPTESLTFLEKEHA